MKALYFDCSSGISGNMTLGALLELIDDKDYLVNELNKLHVDGYHIDITKSEKNGINGTHVEVVLHHEHHHHDHDHEHHHHHDHDHEHHHHDHKHDHHHEHVHRNLYDVYHIIDDSHLDGDTKQLAKDIFLKVAKAESKVHNRSLEEVHFHEVGALDSIVDIIGTAILINKIKPDVIYSSVVNDGYGFIECAHGKMAVPVPATSEIFAANDVLYRQIDIDTELVTPTGAAIIATLASKYCVQPAMKVKKIGWGCGSKDLTIPNVLKVSLGEIDTSGDIVVMETNIDDCTGEILGYTMEQLFKVGALDVFYTPIYMKKNRPAYRLTVVCKEDDINKVKNIIFKETTTIGIRYRKENRLMLDRSIVVKDTIYGPISFKVCNDGDNVYEYPEFEDLKKIALDNNLSIKEIINNI